MPQTIEKFRVFIASPGDVMDERAAIAEVVDELNLTYGNSNNLVIELIKWETHAAPAASLAGTQDIIDADIGMNYDLFIGVLWKKFGTPTQKFGSGTEQEFQNAFKRFHQDPGALQILFYFRTSSPLSLDDIDTVQLAKVREFKHQISKDNILYFSYDTVEEFQRFLRLHIPQRLDGLRNNLKSVVSVLSPQVVDERESVDEEELGILDYQEIIAESLDLATHSVSQIGESTTWIGEEVRKKTAEIPMLRRNSNGGEISNKVLRNFFSRIAAVLSEYSSRINPEIAIFSSYFEKAAGGISKQAILFKLSPGQNWNDQIFSSATATRSIIDATKIGINGMESFLAAVNQLPRMEKELNKARRAVEESLSRVVNTLKVSLQLAEELENELLSNYRETL